MLPTIGGMGEIVKAWPGPVVFLEYDWYSSEEASLQVADLGLASKEGVVVDGVGPRPPVSKPIQCQTHG